MKTKIVIPALFVVEAKTEREAEELAGAMQFAANAVVTHNGWPESILYFDEELPNAIVRLGEEDKNPHSIIGIIPNLTFEK